MSVVSIPREKIKKIDFMVLPNKQRKTIKQMFEYLNPKPDYIINATFYNMANGETIVHSEDENKAYGYTWSNEGIGIKGDKDLLWYDKTTAYGDSNIRDFIGGCPTLVKNGAKYINSGSTVSPYIINNKHYRSFVGFNNTNLYLGYTTSLYTTSQEVQECLNNKMTHAINLDGGGSVSIGKNENGTLKIIAAPSGYRANSSWLLVYLDKTVSQDNPQTGTPANPVIGKTPITIKGKQYNVNGVVDNGKTLVQLRDLQQAGFGIGFVDNCPILNRPGLPISAAPDKSKGNIMIDNKMYKCELKLIDSTYFIHIRQLEPAGYKIGYTTMATLDW